MNYYALIPFFTFLIEGFTCTYILAQESKNPVNKAYLFMALAVMFWGLADATIWTHDNEEIILTIIKISTINWLMIGFLFLNFTYALVKKKRNFIYWASLIAAVGACTVSVSTDQVAQSFQNMDWGRFMMHGPMFLPFVSTVITIPFLYCFYLIYKHYTLIEDEYSKKPIRMILIGTGLSFFLGIFLDVVVPYVLGLHEFIQLGGVPVLIHTVFIFFAITKYKFLKIGVQEAASDLFSNVKDGIIIMDNSQKVIQTNEAVEEMLKWDMKESIDFKAKEISQVIEAYNFDRDYQDYETTIQLNGSVQHLALSQSSIHEGDNAIGRMLLIRDITEAKKAELDIIEKNKKITDSINYAHRIQDAILPNIQQLLDIYPDSFIFYKPKDVVSGDFPWLKCKDNIVYVSAVDCTGHGVPGALMSMIGHFQLDSIVNSNGVNTPSDILKKLHKGVNASLKQDDNPELSDGMDMAFLKIDTNKSEFEYAGAHRPLLFMHKGKIQSIKGDRLPIGGIQYSSRGKEIKFTDHKIKYENGDAVFIFTDGLPDQTGGPKSRRFMQKRIEELILKMGDHSMNEISIALDKELTQWKGNHKQLDDLLMIGIRF
ncbi:MAG: SpoIIE family protein phosphatase [Bacteroidia bacterium]|nr:SpoIIE family protein phosphatase [Bacteroidia bacterium]